jgi:hypothetical protein
MSNHKLDNASPETLVPESALEIFFISLSTKYGYISIFLAGARTKKEIWFLQNLP